MFKKIEIWILYLKLVMVTKINSYSITDKYLIDLYKVSNAKP
jgi:hypothetical protein